MPSVPSFLSETSAGFDFQIAGCGGFSSVLKSCGSKRNFWRRKLKQNATFEIYLGIYPPLKRLLSEGSICDSIADAALACGAQFKARLIHYET